MHVVEGCEHICKPHPPPIIVHIFRDVCLAFEGGVVDCADQY